MRASAPAAVLVFLLILGCLTPPRATACSLPLDPEVAIFMAGRTGYDADANHDRGFVVDEDVAVMWQAYWNASEYGNMPLVYATLGAPDFVFEGNQLYELQKYYDIVGGGKLKVSEIWDRALGGGWETRPDCPAVMDSPIMDATWQATYGGGSAFFSGTPSSPTQLWPTIKNGESVAAESPTTLPRKWTIEDAKWRGGAGKWFLVPGSVTMNWELDCEPQVWNGDMPATATGDQVTVTYPTPTGKEARIHVSSSLCLAFEYVPEGAVFKWKEVLTEDGNVIDEKDFSISWSGQIQKDTGGTAGEMSEAWVRVRDTTPPQHFKADPEDLPDGKVGKSPTGQITFKVLDNNPFADEDAQQPVGYGFYSTQFHGWEHVAGDRPLCGGVNAHPKGCDCQAYHTEKWLWKSLSLDYGGFQVVEEGGQPAYCVYTFTADAASMEALPWHYADGAAAYSYESAEYTDYLPDRLKYFMFCEASVDGISKPAVDCSLADGQEDDSAKEPAATSDNYAVAGGISTIAKKDVVMPPEATLLGEIGASGEIWDKWGKYGTMGVTDDAMPDIRVYVTDTRYNQTFMYGHNDAGDGKIPGYQSAKDSGSGESASNTADSPYKSGDDAPGTWNFNLEGSYADQLSMIGAQAFAPAQNIVEGAPWGFWTDEDTRLVFKVVCRDNMNRWQEPLSYTKELTDGPRGVTLSGNQLAEDGSGNFEYIFHDPNRGANAIAAPCQLRVSTSDAAGKSRELVIDIFVASNDLRLQTLEEERKRVNQSW